MIEPNPPEVAHCFNCPRRSGREEPAAPGINGANPMVSIRPRAFRPEEPEPGVGGSKNSGFNCSGAQAEERQIP